MALFCVPGSAEPASRLTVCVCTRRKGTRTERRKGAEAQREGERAKEREEQGSKSRQWLKSLLPLSISTRTSTRRNLSSYPEEYHPSTFLPPSISPSLFSRSLSLLLSPPRLSPFLTLLAEQIYFTFLPFLDLSQYLAVLWHPAPVAAGTGHQKIRL